MNETRARYGSVWRLLTLTLLLQLFMYALSPYAELGLGRLLLSAGTGAGDISLILDAADVLLYLLTFMVPAVLYVKLRGRHFSDYISVAPRLAPRPALSLFTALAVIDAASRLSSDLGSVVSNITEKLGIRLPEYVSSPPPKGGTATVLAFLSFVVVPAFVEEVVYRGVILGEFMKYGTGFAIAVSASLFGLMHCSAGQLFYTVCAGLVLGLLTVSSGSLWSAIFVHLLNNTLAFFYMYLDEYADVRLNFGISAGVSCIIYFVGVVGALALARESRPLSAYPLERERLTPSELLSGMLNPPVVLFLLATLYLTLT